MGNFLNKIQQWMYGRNGLDRLSRDMNYFGLAIMLISILFRIPYVYYLGFIFVILSLLRSLSKNIFKRAKENRKYLDIMRPADSFFSLQKKKFSDRKFYKYYKCSKCKRVLRVPKGRGKIEVTCSGCHNKFIKKT